MLHHHPLGLDFDGSELAHLHDALDRSKRDDEGVGQAQAIANIKATIDSHKAVVFGT